MLTHCDNKPQDKQLFIPPVGIISSLTSTVTPWGGAGPLSILSFGSLAPQHHSYLTELSGDSLGWWVGDMASFEQPHLG